ncbi:MAG: hypothetical protein KDK48_05155, partial [Chlamydiia bacterium]|nr:hypothetical protein [Chlamydiia bacterium]
PKSRWLVPGYFLIGLSLREEKGGSRVERMQSALQAFQNAERTFQSAQFQENDLLYFATYRFYAGLEKAKTAVSLAHISAEAKKQFFLTYARGALEELSLELEESSSPSSKAVKALEPYPKVQEQIHYELAKVLSLQKKPDEALAALDTMITRYDTLQVTRSEYLSRALLEKGRMLAEKERFREALEALEAADHSSAGGGAHLVRLKIWLLQAECLTRLEEYRDAMRLLSRVINEDIASSLRLKAMYKRAELYRLQEKPELAQRQLQSLAKLKGPWSELAKQELKNDP